MAQITYQNKVTLNPQPGIANINKVTADDMNEIKSVVNENSQTSSNNFGLETNTWTAGGTYTVGSVVVYNENTYKNLTGTNTATTPDQDNTNWQVIPLIVNEQNNSTTNAYSCDYVNNSLEDYQTKGEIIWTNPNPNAEFTNQTINLTDTYSYYDVTFRQDGQIMKTQRCYVDANFNYNLETIYGGYIRTRDLRAYNNSLYFGNGFFYQTYGGTGTTNNNQCIPYQIIGYK